MSQNLPSWGKGPECEDVGEAHEDAPGGRARSSTLVAKSKAQDKKQQAINDAQQGMQSLLNLRADNGHPHIISSTGATRNHTRGRVAGPTASRSTLSTPAIDVEKRLLNGRLVSTGSSLSIVPGSLPLSAMQEETASASESRLALQTARAAHYLQSARDRAGLLVDVPDSSTTLGIDVAAMHTSRRAASKWITRYATHLVVLIVVAAIVALGGLKSLTAQGAYPYSLGSVSAYTGTDQIGADDSASANPSDSQGYTLTLPRTELGGADAAANSMAQVAPVKQTFNPGSANPKTGSVVQYTVVPGDTVASIAAKYNLMPETVMGSNGIYDPEERLAPGRALEIPPIDAMYYVAAKGDTLETVARRFQVEPSIIVSYPGNRITDGAPVAGQPLLIPGGMMPPREVTVSYTVRAGDSLKEIAARFGVDVPTMLNSNNIPDPDNLQIGTQLRVLPVPGLEYKVKKGDNINTIANRFGVTPQMLLDYSPNKLTENSTLQIDQQIMVPGGTPEQIAVAAVRLETGAGGSAQPPEQQPAVQPQFDKGSNSSSDPTSKPRAAASRPTSDNSGDTNSRPTPKPTPDNSGVSSGKPTPKPTVDNSGDTNSTPTPRPTPKIVIKKVESTPTSSSSGINTPKSGTGSFMWPVNAVITQYFSASHNGLDLATAAGTPIYAADSGKVVWSGWRTDGLGYCVIIDHLNGYSTVYGHQIRQPAVYVGQYVSRGQVIGWVGSTGRSTGPHVHFMIKGGNSASRNYLNPLAYLGK